MLNLPPWVHHKFTSYTRRTRAQHDLYCCGNRRVGFLLTDSLLQRNWLTIKASSMLGMTSKTALTVTP